MYKFIITVIALTLSACTSNPVIASKNDIIVSRTDPSSHCKDLGPIEGRSNAINGTTENALDDLKSEAVKKGANVVRLETYGALTTSIRGTAFLCN